MLGEIYLAFTGYNLKRSLTILGFDLLMSKIAAHVSLFVQKYLLFLDRMAAGVSSDGYRIESRYTVQVINYTGFVRFSIS